MTLQSPAMSLPGACNIPVERRERAFPICSQLFPCAYARASLCLYLGVDTMAAGENTPQWGTWEDGRCMESFTAEPGHRRSQQVAVILLSVLHKGPSSCP